MKVRGWAGLVIATAAACTYGVEEERSEIVQIVGLGDSYRALAVVQHNVFRRPTGLSAFPDRVDHIPPGASLPGVMLGRRPGEKNYVRFTVSGDSVMARFDEQAPAEALFRIRSDGSVTAIR